MFSNAEKKERSCKTTQLSALTVLKHQTDFTTLPYISITTVVVQLASCTEEPLSVCSQDIVFVYMYDIA